VRPPKRLEGLTAPDELLDDPDDDEPGDDELVAWVPPPDGAVGLLPEHPATATAITMSITAIIPIGENLIVFPLITESRPRPGTLPVRKLWGTG
jgi:hypothetical protein